MERLHIQVAWHPLLVEILLVFMGAIAGLGGSIIIEIFRGRRDHRRWLLERRYEVYAAALIHVDELLTWARNEATAPGGSSEPAGETFHDFAARLALIGSDRVQTKWHDLDASFRQFLPTHIAAMNARQAAKMEGHADTDDAIRLRMMLDDIVSSARERETELARAMEQDLGGYLT